MAIRIPLVTLFSLWLGLVAGAPGAPIWTQRELPPQIRQPLSGATDPLGNLLLLDGSDGRIWRVDPGGREPPRPFGASEQGAPRLETPTRIWARWGPYVYTLDPVTRQVSIFDLDGRITATRELGPLLDDAGLGDAELADLAVDRAGRLYLLDRFGARVVVLEATGELVAVYGEEFLGPERLVAPVALELTDDARLWVSDPSTGRVVEILPGGGAGATWDLRGLFGKETRPQDLVLDGPTLWVLDGGARRLLRLDAAGERWEAVSLPREWHGPGFLLVSQGRLLAVESDRRRIWVLTPDR
jgi:sugar lactone lactonase YvrE